MQIKAIGVQNWCSNQLHHVAASWMLEPGHTVATWRHVPATAGLQAGWYFQSATRGTTPSCRPRTEMSIDVVQVSRARVRRGVMQQRVQDYHPLPDVRPKPQICQIHLAEHNAALQRSLAVILPRGQLVTDLTPSCPCSYGPREPQGRDYFARQCIFRANRRFKHTLPRRLW